MTDKSNVIWRGDYRCGACGHEEAAAVIGAPGMRYETMDAARVERIAKIQLGLAPCPRCQRQDPAAVAQARKNLVAMIAGYVGMGVVGTIAVRAILGPMAAAIVAVIAAFVLVFLVTKNLGTASAAKKRVSFSPAATS
jgi:hypothetical protein